MTTSTLNFWILAFVGALALAVVGVTAGAVFERMMTSRISLDKSEWRCTSIRERDVNGVQIKECERFERNPARETVWRPNAA